MPSALARVLSSFDVDRRFWSQVLGCSDRQLTDWWVGRREFPFSAAKALSRAIGVPAEIFLKRDREPLEPERLLPPLWLKARQSRLGEEEHRAIAAVRVLAARYEELQLLLDPVSISPHVLFSAARQVVNPQQPARVQGARAAQAFLTVSTLGKGAMGIGEVIRGFLRAHGILILETSISSRKLEGFCVPIGDETRSRPCIVANSYRTTWFRRNYVIMHELAHALFDLDAENAVFDLSDMSCDPVDIAEQRADAFALHALVPKKLLVAVENRGLRLRELTSEGMARLIADMHAEQRLLVRAALEYGLITDAEAERLRGLRVAREVRAASYHARGLADLQREELIYPEVRDWGRRLTTFPMPGLRLPIPYVRLVLQTVGDGKISTGKAAELLMVRDEELPRFGIHPLPDEESLVS